MKRSRGPGAAAREAIRPLPAKGPRTVLTAILIAAAPAGPAFAVGEIPAPPQAEPIAITQATVHTVSGPALADATVLFERGRITAVGRDVALPPGTRVISGAGHHVYPGLIAATSVLGLVEIGHVRATRDETETGLVNPNVRAEVAYNPDSEHIPVTRSNGVLLATVMPRGGLLAGLAALMRLDGWTWEDAVVRAPVGLVLNWPVLQRVKPADPAERAAEYRRAHDERVETIRRAFADARAYLAAREARGAKGVTASDTDQRWEAMIPVLRREIPVLAVADRWREIEEVVAWSLEENVRLVLVGGAEAEYARDLLRARDIPVIVAELTRLPARPDAPYDEPYRLPAALYEANVRFAISGGLAAGANLRNLPYEAGMAVAYGLPPDEALKAITLYPARILGVDSEVGSLEPGKAATLFVADGDILEIPTHVLQVFVDGRESDLHDRHKTLYRKYLEKYRQLGLLP